MKLQGNIRLLTLDAFDTLFSPKAPIGELYLKKLCHYGLVKSSSQELANLLQKECFKHFKKMSQEIPNYGFGSMVPRDWWKRVVHNTLISSDIHTSNSSFETMFDNLYSSFSSEEQYLIYEDAIKTLSEIKNKYPHIQIAVLSNMDDRIVPLLSSLGLSQFVSFSIVSSQVGVMKPDKKIFDLALTRAGLSDPSEALHIGDDVMRDYHGALSAGFQAALLDRDPESHPPSDVKRISSLEKILTLL